MAGLDREMLEFLFVGPLFSIFKKLNSIERKLQDMASQEDVDALRDRVVAVGEKQQKALGEVKAQVQALKDQIAALPVPVDLDLSGVDAAIATAEGGATELDDLNPDPVVETPPVVEEPTPETPAEPEQA